MKTRLEDSQEKARVEDDDSLEGRVAGDERCRVGDRANVVEVEWEVDKAKLEGKG